MGKLVNSVLDLAERMANRHIPMTMEDWAKRIDIILEAGGDAVLHDAGKVSAEFAKSFAEAEFEKYRVIQDKLFNSDFDRFKSSLLFQIYCFSFYSSVLCGRTAEVSLNELAKKRQIRKIKIACDLFYAHV